MAITILSLAWLCLASSPTHAQKVERITMAGGPPTGVFGIFATGIGTYLSKNVPNLDVSVAATGGSVENPRRISAKEAEMGLSFSSDLHESFHGLEKFTGKPLTDLRAIGLVFFGVAHLITYADSGIRPWRNWPANASPLDRQGPERSPRRADFSIRGHLGQDQPHPSPRASRRRGDERG